LGRSIDYLNDLRPRVQPPRIIHFYNEIFKRMERIIRSASVFTLSIIVLSSPILAGADNLLAQEDANANGPAPLTTSTGKQVEGKTVEQPPVNTTEPWIVTVGAPVWLTNIAGTTGFRGINSDVHIGIGTIIPNTNVLFATEAELRKGRFGVLGDFLYADGQAGVNGAGFVSRLGLGIQTFIEETFASYRLIDSPRGTLDLLAGFRFTYIGEQLDLNPNVEQIDGASTELVNAVGNAIAANISDLRSLTPQTIAGKLSSLLGGSPPVPVGPLAGQEQGEIIALVQELTQSVQPELRTAIQTHNQTAISQIKSRLAGEIGNFLANELDRSFSFYDDWFDPVIGLRGRLNLSKAFYLTGESDVGGFGVGSNIAVQEYAAFGCQITRNLRAEVGYRYLYDDFRDQNDSDFLWRITLHGPQIAVAIDF
jgi:hypothetical protein